MPKEIYFRTPGRAEKYSVLKFGNNFSTDLMLLTHYEHKMSRTSATITTIHFVLRVVSAGFQTNRPKPRHQRKLRKLAQLDSYLYNLPSSAKKEKLTLLASKGQEISKRKTIESIVNEEKYVYAKILVLYGGHVRS